MPVRRSHHFTSLQYRPRGSCSNVREKVQKVGLMHQIPWARSGTASPFLAFPCSRLPFQLRHRKKKFENDEYRKQFKGVKWR